MLLSCSIWWPSGLSSHLLLLHGIYKLLKSVSHELQVFETRQFTLFYPCIYGEEACLINFLWLYQSIDPILLPLLQRLDHLSLMQKVLLIFAEVLGANVFNLAQLLVILLLEGLSVSLRLCRGVIDEGTHPFYFLHQLLLELVAGLEDLILYITFVRLQRILDRSRSIEIVLVYALNFRVDLFSQQICIIC